jgi:hypothetical protein
MHYYNKSTGILISNIYKRTYILLMDIYYSKNNIVALKLLLLFLKYLHT